MLVSLVALVFTVLEATLLITLDFCLYENALLALLQLVLRFLIAAAALTLGIASTVNRKHSFLIEGICLLSSSVAMIPFVSNGFGVYFTLISAFFVATRFLLKPSN